MTFPEILGQIEQKTFSPVYYLHGEETYFIDKLTAALEAQVLDPAAEAFNKNVFYGADTQAPAILNAVRSFPMMAERRLVILKEAQRLNKNEWKKLIPYLEKPMPTTVFVMAFKGPRVGLPKEGEKAVKKSGVNYYAKKMYDREVQQWVAGYLKDSGMDHDPNIAAILVSNLGNQIPLIENELQKMFIYLKATRQLKLTQNFVYEMINVDKEFNVFELISAMSKRDIQRVHMIMDRLTQNQKLNPPILTLNNLFRFFSNVALVHTHQLRDPNSIKHQLKVNYFAAKDYAMARDKYPLPVVYRNIGYIQQADLTLKGMIPSHMDASHLLKTLAWRLMN